MLRPSSLTGSVLLLLVAVAPVRAQESPRFEIGSEVGFSILRSGGETVLTIAAPSGGFGGMSAIYGVFYGSSTIAFEPRLGFTRVSSDGSSFSAVDAAGRVRIFFDNPSESAAFAYGEGGVLRLAGDSSSESNFAGGAGLGFRHLATPNLAVTLQSGYRRWFTDGDDANEFTFSLGFGAVVGRS